MKKILKKAAIAVIAVSFATITPAVAKSVSSYGSWASYSGRNVSIKDTKDDGNGVYAIYTMSGMSGEKTLENYSGPGTTVSRPETHNIRDVKACVDDWFTNTCSKWANAN